MVNRRAKVAALVVVLWLGGIAALTRRELFQGRTERLARAAMLVYPGTDYFTVAAAGRGVVGYAESTVDTTPQSILTRGMLIAERPAAAGTAPERLTVRSYAQYTRALVLRRFGYRREAAGTPVEMTTGVLSGDTLLTVSSRSGRATPAVRRVRLHAPLLLPSMMPMAIALERTPAVGEHVRFTIFDPLTSVVRDVSLAVRAESLFTVADSAGRADASSRWTAARRDTVRAWWVEERAPARKQPDVLRAWIDAAGHVVAAGPMRGLTLRRAPYEIAFDNWTMRTRLPPRTASPVP